MKVWSVFRVSLIAIAILAIASIGLAGENKVSALARAVGDEGLQWGPCPEFLPQGCQIAVLQGNPAEKNSDIFFRVPGGSKIASHWHTSAERMVLVSGQLDVTYEGQPTVSLKTGMYAYGPAKAPHSAECRSADPCVLFIAFEEPLDAVETKPAK
jgi:quercetin dioxygenase-like cupin family protein